MGRRPGGSKELTPAEAQVISLCCRGLLAKQIAFELKRAEATVKAQMLSGRKRLGYKTIHEMCFQLGLKVGRMQASDATGHLMTVLNSAFDAMVREVDKIVPRIPLRPKEYEA